MTLQELETTPWAAAFKRDAPVSYAQALAFAAQPRLPVVVRRTDQSGFWVWAVAVEEQPDFLDGRTGQPRPGAGAVPYDGLVSPAAVKRKGIADVSGAGLGRAGEGLRRRARAVRPVRRYRLEAATATLAPSEFETGLEAVRTADDLGPVAEAICVAIDLDTGKRYFDVDDLPEDSQHGIGFYATSRIRSGYELTRDR